MNTVKSPLPDQSESLVKRYASQPPAFGPWNDCIALLMSHRSVRGYLPDALPQNTLQTLIAAAQSAATSSNLQSWSVIAVTDPIKKAAFAEIASGQKHIEQCPLFLIWIADLSCNERIAQEANVHLPVLELTESFLVAAIDAGLAAQNATVAAESLELATVYIGALRNDPERVSELLNLPAGSLAVFGLCVGWADPDAVSEVKPRPPQDAILFYETYGTSKEESLRHAYDRDMAAYSKRNEMQHHSWSQRVIERNQSLERVRKRAELKRILVKLGFHMK